MLYNGALQATVANVCMCLYRCWRVVCVCGEFRQDCILKILVIYLNEDQQAQVHLKKLPEDHNGFGWAQAECKDIAAENKVVCVRGEHHDLMDVFLVLTFRNKRLLTPLHRSKPLACLFFFYFHLISLLPAPVKT